MRDRNMPILKWPALFDRRTILLLGAMLLTIFVFWGCASNDKSRIQRIGKNSTPPATKALPDEILDKKFPEMTGDEYERLGDTLLSRGKLPIAFMQYERSLKQNPGNLRIEYKKGLALLLGRKDDEAISQFRIVLEKDSSFALAYEGLGRAFFHKKDYGEAELNFQKALKLNPTLWKSCNFLGNLYDFQRNFETAVRAYKSALKIKPDNGLLYNNLGVSYTMAGDFKKAVRSFKKAIDLKYNRTKVYNNLGIAYANMKQYSEALQAFKQGSGSAQAYNNLGCIYLKNGMFEEAIHCFEKAIEVEPNFYTTASNNLKKARAAKGQL
jgi:Flp pilus assembly protein TadD